MPSPSRAQLLALVLAGKAPLLVAGGKRLRKATKKELAAWKDRHGYVWFTP